ncbi:MAG: hypothetical protein ABIN58_10135, partial [candidate division WOR-3 bacterium]
NYGVHRIPHLATTHPGHLAPSGEITGIFPAVRLKRGCMMPGWVLVMLTVLLWLGPATAAGIEPSQTLAGLQRMANTGAAQTGQAQHNVSFSSQQEQIVILEPFYLLREQKERVQVERILVTVTFRSQNYPQPIDWQGEELRSAVYSILNSRTASHGAVDQIKDMLQNFCVQPGCVTVDISQTYLLLP